jgi:hypothetical protein
VQAVRSRYDGRKQNPWNDIECGDHYVRAMSSWALLEAASGYSYNAGEGSICFSPVISPERFRAPFVVSEGWGTFSQRIEKSILEANLLLVYGLLDLKMLSLKAAKSVENVLVETDGRILPAQVYINGDELTLIFSESVTIHNGQALTVKLQF